MLPVVALGAIFVVGCGGQKTDISAAVADTNKTYKGTATFDCPDQVDGGEGTKFHCRVKGTKSGRSAPLQLKVIKDGIAPANQKKFEATLTRLAAG